ncbi:hypothetical protein C8F01DRAFT_1124795 [Mycena amicta]|nr:hypothetical protein C8F01DRAFT_1124795 [Mycena amicta]
MSKRNRTSPSSSPSPKAQRTATETPSHPLLCTLHPICHQHPTPIANARDLETHYATYHAHVCESAGCNCVFPDARLLEIHQTECHDPLAALRKERGEKIFACHVASCNKLFQTPKARRLHLIQGHGYPKEYFFAVTNKGVGGLLRRWGEGASLIRGEWKARDPHPPDESVLIEEDEDDQETTPAPEDTTLDSLTSSLNALSLIPPAIRFGRGGKNGGFAHDQPPRAPRRGRGRPRNETMDVEAPQREEADAVLAYVPRGVQSRRGHK